MDIKVEQRQVHIEDISIVREYEDMILFCITTRQKRCYITGMGGNIYHVAASDDTPEGSFDPDEMWSEIEFPEEYEDWYSVSDGSKYTIYVLLYKFDWRDRDASTIVWHD